MAYINLFFRKKIKQKSNTLKSLFPNILTALLLALLFKSLVEINFPTAITDPNEPRPLANLRCSNRNDTDPTHTYHDNGRIKQTPMVVDHNGCNFCLQYVLTDYICQSCSNHTYYNWMINDSPPMFLYKGSLIFVPFILSNYKFNSSFNHTYGNLMIQETQSKLLHQGRQSFVLSCSIPPSNNIKVEVIYNKTQSTYRNQSILSNPINDQVKFSVNYQIVNLNIHAHNYATYHSTLYHDEFMSSKDRIMFNDKKLSYVHKHPILHNMKLMLPIDKVIINDRAQRYSHDLAILHNTKHKSSKSPGNVIHPYKFFLLIPIILMFASTSRSLAAAPISGQSLNKLKVIHTLNVVGQKALYNAYQHTKPFDNSKSIKDHLVNDLSWLESKYKKKFDKTQLQTIETSDKSGKDYDISLLVKCQRVLSEHYEPDPVRQLKWKNNLELEGRCNMLKDKRNSAFHSMDGISNADMITEMDAIEIMVTDILTSLEGRYPHKTTQLSKMKHDIRKEVNDILTHPLDGTSRVKILMEKARFHLDAERPHYKNRSKEWGKMEVLEFLSGTKTSFNIDLLFTDIVCEKSKKYRQYESIDYKLIFTLPSTISILLIEAEAGCGKTTTFRYGINTWGKGSNDMNTDSYDYIFPMIFRNPYICSVNQLISHLIPNVSKIVDMDHVMMCIQDPSQKIIFFCDGYDEKNANSSKLFREIWELKQIYKHINIIITSRPESISNFCQTYCSINIEHLIIRGIHASMRSVFLKKYASASGLSGQSSDELLRFYDKCSARHKELYRLPINLVILSWLWGQDRDIVRTINSAAGLYTAIVDISNKKLLSRIMQSHPDVMIRLKDDMDKLNELIELFKEIMYSQSLLAVRYDRIYIDDSGVKKLRQFCVDNGLPFVELKGAFLLSKVEWKNANDLNVTLEFPHKGFSDFYSANDIATKLEQQIVSRDETLDLFGRISSRLFGGDRNSKGNLIKKIILDSYGADSKNADLVKYQNIVMLLGGILALKDSKLEEKHGRDIIDLLIETGVKNNTQWYETFVDMNVDATAGSKFGNLIEPHLNHTINESDIEVFSTFLKYVDMSPVTLAISSTAMPTGFPSLVKQLTDRKVEVSIAKITDGQVQFWNTVIKQNNDLKVKAVTLDISTTDIPAELLSLFSFFNKIQCEVVIENISKITDGQVKFWNTVIMQNNDLKVKAVTLDISTTAIPAELPSLIHAFREKECNVTIPEISDIHLDLWNSNNMSFAKINTKVINIKNSRNTLPFLSHVKVDKLKMTYLWRDIQNTATPDMTGCDVEQLWTAVDNTDQLPRSLTYLRLALKEHQVTAASVEPSVTEASLEPSFTKASLNTGTQSLLVRSFRRLARHLRLPRRREHPVTPAVEPPGRESGTLIRACVDPGIGQLLTRCHQLTRLGIHIRAGAATGHLKRLPSVLSGGTDLFLSGLEEDPHHIEWAVQTAVTLQPRDGHYYLVLPRCLLRPQAVKQVVRRLAANSVSVRWVAGAGPHITRGSKEGWELNDVTYNTLKCPFYWYDNEEELRQWGW